MYDDSLFTWDQRAKLIALARSAKPKSISDFVKAIENYLDVPFSFVFSDSLQESVREIDERERGAFLAMNNLMRLSALDLITRKLEDRRGCLQTIERCITDLQARYSRVVVEYGDLKRRLLTPKEV